MLRRSHSRSLVASAVLLACLALAAQSVARAERVWAATADTASSHDAGSRRSWPALLAHAQRRLIAGSAKISQPFAKIHADLGNSWCVSVPAIVVEEPGKLCGCTLRQRQSLMATAPWMRTARAWAS